MARPLYTIDNTDPAFPCIVRLPYDPGAIGLDTSEQGMTFGMAKENLIRMVRYQRDHWNARLRAAKALTEQQV